MKSVLSFALSSLIGRSLASSLHERLVEAPSHGAKLIAFDLERKLVPMRDNEEWEASLGKRAKLVDTMIDNHVCLLSCLQSPKTFWLLMEGIK